MEVPPRPRLPPLALLAAAAFGALELQLGRLRRSPHVYHPNAVGILARGCRIDLLLLALALTEEKPRRVNPSVNVALVAAAWLRDCASPAPLAHLQLIQDARLDPPPQLDLLI